VALANPIIFYLFETAATPQQFLFRVATFNIPYRDVQILGIAVVMILGVSLRFLPHATAIRQMARFSVPGRQWRHCHGNRRFSAEQVFRRERLQGVVEPGSAGVAGGSGRDACAISALRPGTGK
jgi:hypothetical protein